jgi:cytochrome c oxidase subunit 2
MVGAHQASLGWLLLVIACVVSLAVAGLVVAGVWRRRSPEPVRPARRGGGLTWIVGGGLILPTLILTVVFVLTVLTQASVAMPARSALTIQVTGHRWWWEVHYLDSRPDRIAVTANEIHLPVGRPVRVELLSNDVIHSLWIPQLSGKTDLIPGQRNLTWLQADRAGIYRGQCGEYCGTQHARMALTVVAEEPAAFEAWLARQRTPAAAPADSATASGAKVFAASACPLCHTVRGTGAGGAQGPDLTHLAGRHTLGAGLLPNDRGHLLGWVANPQTFKPGSLMPAVPLPPADLEAVVSYLQSLK